jgi:hypothetical protein
VNKYSKDAHIRDFHPAEFKIAFDKRIEEANRIEEKKASDQAKNYQEEYRFAMKKNKSNCCEICHMAIDTSIYYQHSISCKNVL